MYKSFGYGDALCMSSYRFKGNKGLGKGTRIIYDIVRTQVPTIKEDKVMYEEINKCENLLKSGIILDEVEKRIGKLC